MGLEIGDLITGGFGVATGNPALIAQGVAGALSPSASSIYDAQATGSGYQGVNVDTSLGQSSYVSPQEVQNARAILASTGTPGEIGLIMGPDGLPQQISRGTGATLTPERRAELEAIVAQGEGYNTQLSPELQQLQQSLFGMAPQALEQFQTFDPTEAGKLFTQRLDELAAPKEEKQRLALENRLFKQGLLSSSAGADQTQAILEAQALAQGQRDITGMEQGQQQQNRLFQQFLDTLGAGTSIGDIERQLINQSMGQAGLATQVGQTQAGLRSQGRLDDAAVQQQFFNNLVSQMPTSFGSDSSTTGDPSIGLFDTDLSTSGFGPVSTNFNEFL